MENFKTVYTPKEIIDFAIEELGTRTQVAAALNVSTSAMGKWCVKESIPAQYAIELAEITNLGPWQINPDIFYPKYAVSQRELRLIQSIRQASARLDEDILREILQQVRML